MLIGNATATWKGFAAWHTVFFLAGAFVSALVVAMLWAAGVVHLPTSPRDFVRMGVVLACPGLLVSFAQTVAVLVSSKYDLGEFWRSAVVTLTLFGVCVGALVWGLSV